MNRPAMTFCEDRAPGCILPPSHNGACCSTFSGDPERQRREAMQPGGCGAVQFTWADSAGSSSDPWEWVDVNVLPILPVETMPGLADALTAGPLPVVYLPSLLAPDAP